MRGLPARGQRTKTNARTRKGKRRTVGASAKKPGQKLTKYKRKMQKIIYNNERKIEEKKLKKKQNKRSRFVMWHEDDIYLTATFNNTLVTVADEKESHCVGEVAVNRDFLEHENRPRLQQHLPLKRC